MKRVSASDVLSEGILSVVCGSLLLSLLVSHPVLFKQSNNNLVNRRMYPVKQLALMNFVDSIKNRSGKK